MRNSEQYMGSEFFIDSRRREKIDLVAPMVEAILADPAFNQRLERFIKITREARQAKVDKVAQLIFSTDHLSFVVDPTSQQ